ncbi:MAG: cupin domain-containing protein [Dehalococcoidia bacterium]|jgi:quercetin dioxygenase-like cupin family protein|nr:cupin domain-containing protein [Dehalococcoidia bacterium]
MPDELDALSPAQLAQRRDMILHRFGRIEEEFDRRRQENRLLAKATDILWESASSVHPTQQEGHRLARIISPELGFNIHTFRVFQREIGGGGVEGAYHTHGDAVKYYLNGRGKEIIGEEEYEVEAGDLAFIPANIWHGTENTGLEPMVFIAFHQLPGTHLPVPAPWQYQVSDLGAGDSLAAFLASAAEEDPAAMDSATLYSRRQHFLHQLGVLDDEFNRRRQQTRYVVHWRDIPWEVKAGAQAVPLVAPELGFNIFTLQVSIQVVPPHYQDPASHSHGESVSYCLNGMGRLTVEDASLEMGAGDLVFVPSGARHSLANPGDEPLRLLVAEQMPGTYRQVPAPWRDQA